MMPQIVHNSNNNWDMAGEILDNIFVFHNQSIKIYFPGNNRKITI